MRQRALQRGSLTEAEAPCLSSCAASPPCTTTQPPAFSMTRCNDVVAFFNPITLPSSSFFLSSLFFSSADFEMRDTTPRFNTYKALLLMAPMANVHVDENTIQVLSNIKKLTFVGFLGLVTFSWSGPPFWCLKD